MKIGDKIYSIFFERDGQREWTCDTERTIIAIRTIEYESFMRTEYLIHSSQPVWRDYRECFTSKRLAEHKSVEYNHSTPPINFLHQYKGEIYNGVRIA